MKYFCQKLKGDSTDKQKEKICNDCHARCSCNEYEMREEIKLLKEKADRYDELCK